MKWLYRPCSDAGAIAVTFANGPFRISAANIFLILGKDHRNFFSWKRFNFEQWNDSLFGKFKRDKFSSWDFSKFMQCFKSVRLHRTQLNQQLWVLTSDFKSNTEPESRNCLKHFEESITKQHQRSISCLLLTMRRMCSFCILLVALALVGYDYSLEGF